MSNKKLGFVACRESLVSKFEIFVWLCIHENYWVSTLSGIRRW